jgi:Rieske 2Fe-2S family protein
VLVRDDQGALQGFHNTCRHRGAALCRESEGTLRTGSIICPYHAWVYNLQGELLRTSSRTHASGFHPADYPLYKISVKEWNGFVFVALTGNPPPFERIFDLPLDRLDAWPLQELVVGHVLLKTIQSNWKIFWENYNECLHCPGVHPALSSLVPIYKRGIMEPRDDPKWRAHEGSNDPLYAGGLKQGAQTWSLDGKPVGPTFPQLTAEERRLGYHYMTSLPSHYLVLHVDHVRSSRLLPLGPEAMELEIQWLFPRETLAEPATDIARACDFSAQVMSEDGAACELTQRGLHSAPHKQGYLLPEDYDVYRFQQWVRAQLG